MKFLAIASGKGGVGKSMLSANLAIALAKRGAKVIAVDLDLGGSNLHLTLGQIGKVKGVGTYLDNRSTNIREIIHKTEYDNLYFIPGESELPGLANVLPTPKQRLMEDLKTLNADYVILDLGAGTHFNTTDFFLLSGEGIIVTTPTVTANLNAYLFIKNCVFRMMGLQFDKASPAFAFLNSLKRDGVSLQRIYLSELCEQLRKIDPKASALLDEGMARLKPRLILNMVEQPEDTRKANRLRTSCKEYLGVNLEHLGAIYYDEIQARALNSRLPAVVYKPKSVLAQGVSRIADKILTLKEDSFQAPLLDIDKEDSFSLVEKEANNDFELKTLGMQELLHSGNLSEGHMVETIKTQQFEINQLKKENNFLKKKLLDNLPQ